MLFSQSPSTKQKFLFLLIYGKKKSIIVVQEATLIRWKWKTRKLCKLYKKEYVPGFISMDVIPLPVSKAHIIFTGSFQNLCNNMNAPQLQRKLGLWACVSMVIGSVIGSSIFMKPATMAAQLGSPLCY